MMNRYSAGLLILLAFVIGLAQARPTSSSSSSSSTATTLAKGALIAIIVCVVVGVLVCCLCTFCIIRMMKRRKAAKTTAVLPLTSNEKPVASTAGELYGYNGGGHTGQYPPAPGNGTPQDYNAQQPPIYGGQQDYTGNHQNEYNAAYNPGQQQTYAPPPGPPGGVTMPTPGTHY